MHQRQRETDARDARGDRPPEEPGPDHEDATVDVSPRHVLTPALLVAAPTAVLPESSDLPGSAPFIPILKIRSVHGG